MTGEEQLLTTVRRQDHPLSGCSTRRVIVSPNDDGMGWLWVLNVNTGDVDCVPNADAVIKLLRRLDAAAIRKGSPGVITLIEWRDMPAGFVMPEATS